MGESLDFEKWVFENCDFEVVGVNLISLLFLSLSLNSINGEDGVVGGVN